MVVVMMMMVVIVLPEGERWTCKRHQ